MHRPIRAAVFLAVALLSAVLSGAMFTFVAFAAKATSCKVPTQAGAFLAYCEAPTFGDYEHAAYAFGLQPHAIDRLKAADVLFLGSSIAQVGFSTDATTAFFARNPIPYYLLGFGYGEQAAFITGLVQRFDLHPKVLVIDADPFFMDALSAPGQATRKPRLRTMVDYAVKRAFIAVQGPLCRMEGLCSQTEGSIYRIEETGAWIWKRDWTPDLAIPVTAEKRYPFDPAGYPAAIAAARRMMPIFGVRPECIILTGTPNAQVPTEEIATRLGQALGLTVLLPDVSGLTTMDRHHLSPDSAERWAAAFLPMIRPILDRCLGRAVASG